MEKRKRNWRSQLAVAASLMALGAVGCASMGSDPASQRAANAEPPRVQDCGIVAITSPSKYACNGKVYTSFELAKLRLEWEKAHGG
jgi:hypothetical protein